MNYIFNKPKKRPKKGFTLIELIVVIAIITILSAALLPKLGGYITESKKVEAINQARNVVNAYEMLKTTDLNLPDSSTVLQIKNGNTNLLEDTDCLPDNLTVKQCIGIVDGSYSFSLDDDNKISDAIPK